MSLTKIYNSKLYLTSNRKDKIHAAMEDPINVELVQQISDYLDDDSKKVLKQAIADNEAKEAANAPASDTSEETNVFDGFTPSSHGGGSGGHSSGGFSGGAPADLGGDMPEGDLGVDMPSEDGGAPTSDAPDTEPVADEPVEENTAVTQEEVISAEDINAEEETAVLQSGIIKKLLNDQEDAQGVVRVDIDDKDVWIYYDDKVNLNDVLDNVISIIKSNGYDMLKFSRLARTDNAVVFDIKE